MSQEALIRMPFSEVRDKFNGFQPLDTNDRGYPLARKPSHQPGSAEGGHSYSSTYHVETQFTPEQSELVMATMACLNGLLRGRTFNHNSRPVLPFSTRVANAFLVQEENPSFSQPLNDSLLGLLDNFKDSYPNLMPALKVIMFNGGAIGFRRALMPMRLALRFSIQGVLTEENKRTFFGIDHEMFVGQHPMTVFNARWTIPDDLLTFETWCPADGAVQTLVLETKEAALHLSRMEGVRGYYVGEKENGIIEELPDRLEKHITNLLTEASEEYAKKEL